MKLGDLKREDRSDESIQDLVEDIRQHGVKHAIVVDGDTNEILCGNRRAYAAEALRETGYDVKIQAVVLTGLTDALRAKIKSDQTAVGIIEL